MNNKVNILGTDYELFYKESSEDEVLNVNECLGYTCGYSKKIILCVPETLTQYCLFDKDELDEITKETLRHELVHAFLTESGLDYSTSSSDNWARNEEMVDWIGFQVIKIHDAYIQALSIYLRLREDYINNLEKNVDIDDDNNV